MLYSQQALSFAEKENNKLWISISHAYIGKVYEMEGNYDTAVCCFNKALDIAIDEKIDHQEAYLYSNIGALNFRQGKVVTALNYFIKALAIYQKRDTIDNKIQILIILSNIGGIYRGLENTDQAIYYLEKAEKMADELNYPAAKIKIYYDLGDIFRLKKEYDKALDYALKSQELCYSFNNDKMHESANSGALALIYKEGFNDNKKAEEYANEALRVAKELNDPFVLIGAWRILAEVYLDQKRFDESDSAGMNAWRIDSTSMDQTASIAYNIGIANIYLDNKDKSVYFLDKSLKINRDLSNKNFQNLLIDIETKYETEKKEERIAVLEKEQKLYIWLGVSITTALLLAIGLLFYRHRSATQKRKLAEQQIVQLEQEKELIAVQSSLKAEKAERDLIAHDLHDSVSSLLTVVKNNMNLYADSEHKKTNYFNNAFEVLSKSITELRRVVYHLKSFILTKEGLAAALDDFCRFIPNAEFHFKGLDRRFDPDKEYVLYDCTCELINNALKHSEASRIEVHLNIDEQTVYLSVADNGRGFDAQNITFGIGIDNIRNNLSAFGGHLDILSESGRGTEANIEMDI